MNEKTEKTTANRTMTRIILITGVAVLCVALFLLFGIGHRYKSLSPEAAMREMANNEDCLVADVRQPDEYAEGHVPGAVNIPLDDILEERFGDALPDKSQTILVYCYAGRRSKAAAEYLTKLGYRNVYEFGGIVDWPGEIVTD